MAAVGVVVIVAVIRRRPVVRRRRRMVAAVLPVVVVVVVVVMGIVMVVVVIFVVVVVVANAMVTTKALAQGKLGGQLSDGLPLVQDGLLLPHKALAQVQDGGFGLVRHHATPAAAIVAISVAVTARSMGHTGWRIAAGVCFWGDWGADKFGANAIVMFYTRQTACCCCT